VVGDADTGGAIGTGSALLHRLLPTVALLLAHPHKVRPRRALPLITLTGLSMPQLRVVEVSLHADRILNEMAARAFQVGTFPPAPPVSAPTQSLLAHIPSAPAHSLLAHARTRTHPLTPRRLQIGVGKEGWALTDNWQRVIVVEQGGHNERDFGVAGQASYDDVARSDPAAVAAVNAYWAPVMNAASQVAHLPTRTRAVSFIHPCTRSSPSKAGAREDRAFFRRPSSARTRFRSCTPSTPGIVQ
jgi:hypothetical protein